MRLLFTILFSLLLNIPIFSQTHCGSTEILNKYLTEHPAQKNKRDKMEKNILSKPLNYNKQSMTIPVVFHVLYNTSVQNISDNQIMSQLNVLNEDFNRTNSDAFNTPTDFAAIVSSMQINFCLAKRTPNGTPTTGIIRQQTNTSSFALFDTSIHYNSLGGSDAWDSQKYLNIWISNISGGILGWAQFPDAGNINTDGVVIDYRHFGTTGTAISPYDLGRTTTHEVGHYFNLFHIWGDNNCGNDWVSDTPIQEEANFGCKTHPHVSCNNSGDMFMNFMDYTNDNCMNSFTLGQRNRVWNSINMYRSDLLTSDGCNPVIPSTADAGIIKILEPTSIMSGCNNPIYPKVVIKNYSSDNLYTAVVKYNVNSSADHFQYWNGNLSQNETDTLLLSGISIGGTSHIINVELIQPNSQADINISNNSESKLFTTEVGTSVNVNIITDNYANETSWILMENNWTIIDFGDSLENNTEYNFNYCLEDGCYKFVINDSQGDGICCNYGNGNYSIIKELNNQVITTANQFTFSDTLYFCNTALSITETPLNKDVIYPNPSVGIFSVNSRYFSNDIPIFAELFNLSSKQLFSEKITNTSTLNFTNLESGMYILKLEQNNIITTHKVIINKQ